MYAAYEAITTCMFAPFSLNSYCITKFSIPETSYEHGWNLYLYYLMCFSSFLDYYVTYFYNLIFSSFHCRELGRAPTRRFSLPMNPGIDKLL